MIRESIPAKATPKVINALAAPTDRNERLVSDGVERNLFLRIGKTGAKSWRWQSSTSGKTVKKSLGTWPDVGLAEARDLARAQNFEAKNPSAVVKVPTFEEITESWLSDKRAAGKGLRSLPQYKGQIERYFYPTLRNKPVDAITREDISAIVDKVRKTAPVASNRVATLANTLWKWMLVRDLVTKNIANHITKYNEALRSKEKVAFSVTQMAQLYVACGDLECPEERDAIRLLVLLGLRKNESFGARMSDFDGTVWTLPEPDLKEFQRGKTVKAYPVCHTKNGEAHYLRLPPMAKAIFTAREGKEFLFTDGPAHHWMFPNGLANARKAVAARGYEFPDKWEFREIRRGFRTGLVSDEMAASGHVITEADAELAINHLPSKLVRIYTKTNHVGRIGDVMDKWDALLSAEIAKL